MGLFTPRSDEEKGAWAALPGEPLEESGADALPGASDADLLGVGLGAQYTSVVFPVAPAAPDAATVSDDEPQDDDPDEDEPAAS